MSRVVAFQVCSSITLAWAAPIRAVNESISTIGLWSGEIAGSSWRRSGIFTVSACFWKNSWPSMPAGARTSDTGRSTRWGRISFETAR